MLQTHVLTKHVKHVCNVHGLPWTSRYQVFPYMIAEKSSLFWHFWLSCDGICRFLGRVTCMTYPKWFFVVVYHLGSKEWNTPPTWLLHSCHKLVYFVSRHQFHQFLEQSRHIFHNTVIPFFSLNQDIILDLSFSYIEPNRTWSVSSVHFSPGHKSIECRRLCLWPDCCRAGVA